MIRRLKHWLLLTNLRNLWVKEAEGTLTEADLGNMERMQDYLKMELARDS